MSAQGGTTRRTQGGTTLSLAQAQETAGLLPGVVYPPGFPPTTRDHVRAAERRLPVAIRTQVENVFTRKAPLKAWELRALLGLWRNAPVDAFNESSKLHDAVLPETRKLLLTGPLPGLDMQGLARFFKPWEDNLADWRARITVRRPIADAIGAYLADHQGDEATEDEKLETRRMVVGYADLAVTIGAATAQHAQQVRSIIAARQDASSLVNSLALGVQTLTGALAEVVRETAKIAAVILKAAAEGLGVSMILWIVAAGAALLLLVPRVRLGGHEQGGEDDEGDEGPEDEEPEEEAA